MGKIQSISVGGAEMDVYLAYPHGWGPFPAVVLVHRFDGLADWVKDRADRLAKAGFMAVAPDMFHRSPKALDVRDKGKELLDKNIVADIQAAFEFAKTLPGVDRDAIAIMGHCMGGRMSFLGAAAVPGFKACVVYYGGGMFLAKGDGPPPFERLKDIRCPVVGFFGNEDTNPSRADVDRIDAELTRSKVKHEFHRFDGVGHGFQSYDDPAKFRDYESFQSWNRTLSFLLKNLKKNPSAAAA